MPSSVHKVTKALNRKKKDVRTLHEDSRNAKRLRRAAGRDERLVKQASLRERANEPLLDRIRYLQNAVVAAPEKPAYSAVELRVLAEECVAAYEPELRDLKAARRPGRPASSREDWLKARLETERKEFDVGYWLPDLLDAVNVERLRNWDGEWSMLSPIAFVRISSKGVVTESRWPPNGMS